MRHGSLALIGAVLVGCASPTASNGVDALASATAELRAALTQPVVSDLFQATAYVTSALATGPDGCAWGFDFPTRRYQPSACAGGPAEFTIYTAAEPDLPHRGTAFLLAFPLEAIGKLELHHPSCTDGLRVVNGGTLLHACPAANDGWTATLVHGQTTYQLEGSRETLSSPARTRHEIRLRGAGADVTLQHDIITGIERSENILTVERGGRVLRMEGFAGAVGPAYEAMIDGRDVGAISWQGNAGFVPTGAFDATLSAEEELMLREGEYLIRALARVGTGVAGLVGR